MVEEDTNQETIVPPYVYPSHELHDSEGQHVLSLSSLDNEGREMNPEIRQMMIGNNDHNQINEISTPFNGGKAQYGAMFDIRSLPNNIVRIDSLAFHTLEVVQRCNIQVFTKRGSHEFFEEESSAWKRIKSVTTECRGPGRKTVVSLSDRNFTDYDDVRIDRSERRAFYIRSIETQIIYSVADKQNTVFKEDDHVQIFTGVAVGQYFKDFWTPRMLNVAATYVIERIWNGHIGVGGRPDASTFGQPLGDDVCTKQLKVMTKDGVNKNFGIMFNIKSNSERDLTVYGLGFYVDTSSQIEYEIYILNGGFEHGSATMSLWTKVAQGKEDDANRGTMIMASESNFAPVRIKSGETYGFYLTFRTENLQYHSTSVTLSSTYLQNKDLAVSVGAGVGGYPLNINTLFLARRALKGTVLYGVDKDCRPETSVKYTFIVKYPKLWSTEEVYGEINTTIEKIIKFFLRSDESLKAVKESADLQLSSVFSQHDSDPPAICTNIESDSSCDTIVTEMVFSYEDEDLDEGHVDYKILQHVNTVVNNLNAGSLDVEYTGEEIVDTSMLITLDGVPKKTMSSNEVGYFQGVTKGFLRQKEEGTLRVLSVQVQKQALKDRRHLQKSPLQVPSEGNFIIRAGQESGIIDIQTKITGKHQPPSPDLDFGALVEDSINAEDGSFKEELRKGNEDNPDGGSSYFDTVREVYAEPVSIFPTKAPTLEYVDPKSTGISGPITIAIIVCAALLTFGAVFGAFVYRKRQQDKKRHRKSIFDDDDEEDPLFFDVFEGKRPNNTTTIIPPFPRAKGSKRAPSVVTEGTAAISEDTSARLIHQLSGYRGMQNSDRKLTNSFGIDSSQRNSSNQIGSNDFYGGNVRRHSLSDHYGSRNTDYISGRNQDDMLYRSTPVIAHVDAYTYEDRIQQKFREGPTYERAITERMNRSNPRINEIDPSYEDRILRKFQEESRPSHSEGNYSRRSSELYGEVPRNFEMNRQHSRHSTQSDHDERIKNKYEGYAGDLSGDPVMERQRSRHSTHSSEHEERIRKKFQGLHEEKERSMQNLESEMERQRSRQSAHSSEHEERIRKKFLGLNEDENKTRSNSELDMERQRSRQSAYSSERHEERIMRKFQGVNEEENRVRSNSDLVGNTVERQRSRQSALSNEHEERVRMKQQGLNNLIQAEEKPPRNNLEGNNNAWDMRKKSNDFDSQDKEELPAHLRFERRPSEDGLGIDVMSASTASTLSTHFTRIKKKEGN